MTKAIGERYSPSNKFNILLLIACFCITTILYFLLATVVSLINVWLIKPYTGILLSFLASFLFFQMQKIAVKISLNRNKLVSRISIALTGILASFFHVFVFYSSGKIISNGGSTSWLKALLDIWVAGIALFRWPKIALSNFLGFGAAWVIYFIIIIITHTIIPIAAAKQAAQPFFEEEKKWLDPIESIGKFEPFALFEHFKLIDSMKKNDVEVFLSKPIYLSKDPSDYAVVVFHKVGNRHSGYISVLQYNQKIGKEGSIKPNKFEKLEIVTPTFFGVNYSQSLESAINNLATTGKSNKISITPSDEDGYNVYRTLSDAANYTYREKDGNNKPEPIDDDSPFAYNPAINRRILK